jgi:hypothetical protein
MILMKTMRLVTYGCGDQYRPELFQPINNRQHIKPHGGLWASPVGCAYGWKEWCQDEKFGDLTQQFETFYEGQTLTVASLLDLTFFIWQQNGPEELFYRSWPDYEAMRDSGIDAIYVTENGQAETR